MTGPADSERPTIRWDSDKAITLREMVLGGRGVHLTCQRCWKGAERTAVELLERHWRHIDARLAEIMARTSCPHCEARAVTLQTVRGETPFPLGDYKAEEARSAHARRRERFEAWLAERRAADESPPPSEAV